MEIDVTPDEITSPDELDEFDPVEARRFRVLEFLVGISEYLSAPLKSDELVHVAKQIDDWVSNGEVPPKSRKADKVMSLT